MIRIPRFAKAKARSALRRRERLSKSEQFGLSPSEARKQGVASGVSQARKLLRKDSLSVDEAKQYKAFIDRFENRYDKSDKVRGAVDLWGGPQFDDYIERELSRRGKR